jgi:hypothetical protein
MDPEKNSIPKKDRYKGKYPRGILAVEMDYSDPMIARMCKHANHFAMNHNDTDMYICFVESTPPFKYSNADDVPDDYVCKAKPVAVLSLPIVNLYTLRAVCEEQIRVYESRFGELPYIHEWRLAKWKREQEEKKIETLKKWGWLPLEPGDEGYEEEGDDYYSDAEWMEIKRWEKKD